MPKIQIPWKICQNIECNFKQTYRQWNFNELKSFRYFLQLLFMTALQLYITISNINFCTIF